MPNRTCVFPGCTNRHDAKGYCSTHNSRIRTHGDPYGKRCDTCKRPLLEVFKTVRTQSYCGDSCRPACAFAGCGKKRRKITYCEIHYNQLQRGGTLAPRKHEWTPAGSPCAYCGQAAPPGKRWKYCTDACEALHLRHGDTRPKGRHCGCCGELFTLEDRTDRGNLRKSSTKMCRRCSSSHRKYGMSAIELAMRDGTNCHICAEAIDMTLRRADSVFCPSIDHIKPRALGGSDDPENLALAHFWCNAVKSDREGFTIA